MTKNLTAFDISGKPYSASEDDFKFRVSVFGILVENNNILLQQNPKNKLFNLPGGAIEINESEQEAVKREFLEETGYSVEVADIISSEYKLFTFDNSYYHNVLLFYKVKKNSDIILPLTDREDSLGCKFFNINKLDFKIIQPVFHNIINKIKCH